LSTKIKKVFLYIFLAYTIIGLFIIPFVVKLQLPKSINSSLKAKFYIENVYFNPFIFKLYLEKISLEDLHKNQIINLDSLVVDIDMYSLFYGAINIHKVYLKNPLLYLSYDKNKILNLQEIIKQDSVDTENSAIDETTDIVMPRIIIGDIEIESAYIKYDDFSKKKPFSLSLYDFGFKFKDFDSMDINSSKANFRLFTHFDDYGMLDIHSSILALKPFIVDGDLKLEGKTLYTLWRYIQENLNLEVADGKLSFAAQYHYDGSDLNNSFLSDLSLDINKLRIKPKDKDIDILMLKKLFLKDADIKPFANIIHLYNLGVDGLDIQIKKDQIGDIDWVKYIKINTKEEIKDENKTKSIKWNFILDRLSLEDINLEFNDKSLTPIVTNKVKKLNIYANNITLENEIPIKYQLNTLLNNSAKCTSNGYIKDMYTTTFSDFKCKDIDIVHNLSYIEEIASKTILRNNLKLKSAKFDFDLNLIAQNLDKNISLNINDSNLSIIGVSVDKKDTKEKLAKFKEFKINGINVDTQKKSLDIRNILLDKLHISSRRYKDGKLNLENLVVLKKKSKQQKSKQNKDSKTYRVKLKEFDLNLAEINFQDNSLRNNLNSKIDKINIKIKDIDSKRYSWLKYKLSSRVNNKGKVSASGSLRASPIKQKGNFKISNISLKELTPYIQENFYIEIADGRISLDGTTNYFPNKTGADLIIESSFKLNSLFVNDTRNDIQLFTLNDLDIKSFTYEMNPNRFYVEEMNINSFYVNAMIDKHKVLNFSKLSKSIVDKNISTTSNHELNTSNKFPVSIAKISFLNGSAEFSDYSIPIKFKTNIHNLSGDVYAISNISGETSYININGDVDKYGLTKMIGSIDGSNPKLFMDIDLSFKNLNLNSMSGYSSSFAGYEIDSGKLFLDLKYKIVNSQLQSSNNLMIKKIKLGKEIEDENITKLPLGFVIGLLEDNDGIIDIDLPIEGDVDEPEFKYSTVVWNVFSNLITKAVTAPFKFLASSLGIDGDTLEYIEFEPARDIILPTEREKLDNIAKILIKKPKVMLSFGGTYDKEIDKKALQRDMLIAKVVKMSDADNSKKQQNSMSIELLEDIYENLSDDDKLDKLKKQIEKETNEKNFQQVYRKKLIGLCIGIQKVSQESYLNLAKSRQDAIYNYLTINKGIEKDRLILEKLREINDDKNMIKTDMEIKIR